MNRFTLLALLLIFNQVEATFPNGFFFSSLIAPSTPAPSKDGTKDTFTDDLDNPSSLIDLLLDITNETDVTPVPPLLMNDEEVDPSATEASNIESITN